MDLGFLQQQKKNRKRKKNTRIRTWNLQGERRELIRNATTEFERKNFATRI